MTKRSTIQDKLDGDIPSDVPHWTVELHVESSDRHLTPLQAVRKAVAQIRNGPNWHVTHVRSGLTWDVDLGCNEVIEVVERTWS
jgi:hypothetical protein